MDDRRRSTRHRTLKAGKILYNRRLNVLDCVVRNMSDGGACLEVDGTNWLPETFDLSIPMDGFVRACRVVWKSDHRVGVAYLATEARPRAA